MTEQVEVRGLDGASFGNGRAAAQSRGIGQIVERDLENLLHLSGMRDKYRPKVRNADDWMQGEAADDHIDGCELAEHADGFRIDADLLRCFPKGGLRDGLARVCRASRQADLSRVPREVARSHRQRDRRT